MKANECWRDIFLQEERKTQGETAVWLDRVTRICCDTPMGKGIVMDGGSTGRILTKEVE